MLKLPDAWVWDFWLADDGDQFHIFFLNAPKSLGEPLRRHRAARIGHAVSPDLSAWELRTAAFDAGTVGSFDETATWTGCVVRGDDGLWRMFYTGTRFLNDEPDVAHIESVGVAVSADLEQWEKRPGPITQADPRWYQTYVPSEWTEEAWRDPWVFRDPSGDGWHMLLTASANQGARDDRGVIGHAYSADLESWEVLPPLSVPGSGFAYLEVPQIENIDGQWMLFFSCQDHALSAAHAAEYSDTGSWAVPLDSPTGLYDVARARPITTSRLYSSRVVKQRNGDWALLGFVDSPPEELFVGVVADPVPLSVDETGCPFLATEAVVAS